MMRGSEQSNSTENGTTTMDIPHGTSADSEMMPSPTSGRGSGQAKQRVNGVVVVGKADPSNDARGESTGKRRVRRRKVVTTKEDATQKLIKYAALLLLVAQMVGLVLLMRYSRTNQSPDQPLYLASTAVLFMELMKFVICCAVVAYQTHGNLLSELYTHVWASPIEMAKLCVPSLLYTIQNNLLYLALTNLDAATYQVCYQLKILTTALFSATLLQRQFSRTKWVSLVILTVGVAIVQISGSGDKGHKDDAGESHNRFVGLAAVLCAACTSGFSGVYFEKILKGSSTTLWIRNIQMGLPSILIAYITVLLKDSAAIAEQGFLGGYTTIVWIVVLVQAAGGLIVAVVVKYADNVLKVFATSFSIIISCIISAILFDFRPNFSFLIGASLVVIATVLYSKPPSKKRRRPQTLLPKTAGH